MLKSVKQGKFYNHSPIKSEKITSIQFSLLTQNEKNSLGAVEILHKEQFSNKIPIKAGIFDPGMGTISRNYICATCGLDMNDCPGHFGKLDLGTYILQAAFIHNLKDFLKLFCFSCSRILLDEQTINKILKIKKRARLPLIKTKYLTNNANIRYCNHCGTEQPIFEFEKTGKIYYIFKVDKNILRLVLSAEMIYEKFSRILDSDLYVIGINPKFSRPENIVSKTFLIVPPSMRPPRDGDEYTRPDDKDRFIGDIIETVNTLKSSKGDIKKIDRNVNDIFCNINAMFSNKHNFCQNRMDNIDRKQKTITESIKGKKGLVQGLLHAKRVDFSARTVISPYPGLKINQVGIPKKVAMSLTVSEVVTDHNIKLLQAFVDNGTVTYPGAYLVNRAGILILLEYQKEQSFILEYGDIVERHMIDGDVFMFNRQPTLHRMSMMCHIAKIMKRGDTFRMNVADTKPYNADRNFVTLLSR